MFKHSLLLFWLFLSLLATSLGATSAQEPDKLCFTETNQCIEGRFLEYWKANGGLPVFGYPISDARNEVNQVTGKPHLTQWFERYRFELHPDNKAPYDVLLGRLGSELSEGGIPWISYGPDQQEGCLTFDATPYAICNGDLPTVTGFRTFWESHGLKDPALSPQQQSLALFGYPISPIFNYYNPNGDLVTAQYFERARFEAHHTERGTIVLLGHLAKERRAPQTVWQTVRNRIPQDIAVYEPRTMPADYKAPVIYSLDPSASSLDGVNYTVIYDDVHGEYGYDAIAFILGVGYQGWDGATPLNPEPVEVRGVQGVLSVGTPQSPTDVMVQWEENGQTYRIVAIGERASRAELLKIIDGLEPVR